MLRGANNFIVRTLARLVLQLCQHFSVGGLVVGAVDTELSRSSRPCLAVPHRQRSDIDAHGGLVVDRPKGNFADRSVDLQMLCGP